MTKQVLRINYREPSFLSIKRDFGALTDKEIAALLDDWTGCTRANREYHTTLVQRADQIADLAGSLYGPKSSVVTAIRNVAIPSAPDCSVAWRKFIGKVNNARNEARIAQTQAARRAEANQRRREQRQHQKRLEADRAAYVADLRSSD